MNGHSVSSSLTYDADTINAIKPTVLAFPHLLHDKLIKTFTSAFFHSFEAEPQIDWKLDPEGLVSFQDVHPSEDRAFIIGRAATNQTAILLINNELEWIGVPAVG